VAALGSLGPVELDDELVSLVQVAGESRPVAPSALDRPRPHPSILLGEGDESGVAIGGGLDGALAQHPAGSCVECGGAVACDVGVDPDHDVDDFRQTVHALLLSPEGRGRFRSGRRQAGL